MQMSAGAMCAGVSLGIYLSLATVDNQTIEACAEHSQVLHWIDMAVNVFLLIYYLVRVSNI